MHKYIVFDFWKSLFACDKIISKLVRKVVWNSFRCVKSSKANYQHEGQPLTYLVESDKSPCEDKNFFDKRYLIDTAAKIGTVGVDHIPEKADQTVEDWVKVDLAVHNFEHSLMLVNRQLVKQMFVPCFSILLSFKPLSQAITNGAQMMMPALNEILDVFQRRRLILHQGYQTMQTKCHKCFLLASLCIHRGHVGNAVPIAIESDDGVQQRNKQIFHVSTLLGSQVRQDWI